MVITLRGISLALFSASIAPLRLNRFAKNLAPNARFPGIAVRRREERARKRPVRVGFGFTCQVKASDFGEMAGIALFAAFASSCLRRSSAASGSTPLHAAARKGLLCPAYCLMPDHLHLVWMGLRHDTDQRNGLKFLRSQLGRSLRPGRFQHQPHDHVLKPKERQRHAFSVACADYVLLNPLKAGLVKAPGDWPYLGAVVPGYPRLNPLDGDYWLWFWKHYYAVREPGLEKRVLPPREME